MTQINVTFTGAQVLRPDGFSQTPLSICEGQVVDYPQARTIDLTGYRIFPGVVDLHGDAFERHLAPRRGLVQDRRLGLLSLDRELAAEGITTGVLAQFWSWEGGMRRPPFAISVAEALADVRSLLLTDVRFQLRLEMHLIDDYPDVLDLIDRTGIAYLVLNDHLPHEHLAAGKKPPRLTGQALKSKRSPEAHLQLMHDLRARGPELPAALDQLAADLTVRGVKIGSHDDRDPATRAAMHARGVTISEFPETREATEAAHAAGDAVLLGAPNVVRGGSHAGNQKARAAVEAGLCDALVSDYHYPSMIQAADLLADLLEGGMPAAWHLISAGPARIMGWTDRGSLTADQRADLIIRGPEGRVEATLAAGRISHMAGEVAARFVS